jgi:hypothetical protein
MVALLESFSEIVQTKQQRRMSANVVPEAPAPAVPKIEVRHVCFHYGATQALFDVTLSG